ncbi:MAG: hypothetical protein ABI577_16675, partial [bacterium]
KSKKRQGSLLLAALLAILVASVGALAVMTSAFAHHATVTGQAVCGTDGKWTVNWNIANSESDKYMFLTNVVVQNAGNNVGTTSATTPDPVGFSGAATAQTTNIPANIASVKMTVTADWYYYTDKLDHSNDNKDSGHVGPQNHSSVDITRPTNCDGNIIVKKVKDPTAGVPAADGSLFSGTISGAASWGTITFGGSTGLIPATAGAHTVAETGTQAGWTPVGWKVYADGSAATACSTTKADYTANGGSSVSATVVANHTVVVCVMNTKTDIVVTEPTCTNGALCALVVSPGYWKNWDNHMSEGTFQGYVTSAFGANMTQAQVEAALDSNAACFKHWVSAKLNVARYPQLGTAIIKPGSGAPNVYEGKTVAFVLGLVSPNATKTDTAAPCDADLTAIITYLGAGAENQVNSDCWIVPPSCVTGNIIVKKVKDPTDGVPAADGSLFGGTISDAANWGTITFGGATDPIPASAGAHTVKETAGGAGWTPYGWALALQNGTCPTEKASYALGDSIDIVVVANQTTVVCVMNTKAPVVIAPSVTVAKTHDPSGPFGPGGTFKWKLAVTVTGSQTTAITNITDTIPAPLTAEVYTSYTVTPGITCNNPDTNNSTVTCSLASGSAVGVYNIEIDIAVPAQLTQDQCKQYTNTVTITGTNVPTTPGGPANTQTASDNITVSCNPGTPNFSKSDGTKVGSTIQWTITIKNNNQFSSTYYVYDANAAFVSSTVCTGAGENPANSDFFTCTLGAGLTGTLTISTTLPSHENVCAPLDVTNTAYLVTSNTLTAQLALLQANQLASDGGTYHENSTPNASCLTVKKENAGNGSWTITFTNSSDQALSVDFSDTYQPGSTGTDLDSIAATNCNPAPSAGTTETQSTGCDTGVPAGGTKTIGVGTDLLIAKCEAQTVSNTVGANFNGTPIGVAQVGSLSASFTLNGDPALCSHTVKVCKIVVGNGDGIQMGGEFQFGGNNGGSTLEVVAYEPATDTSNGTIGTQVCGNLVVPNGTTAINEFGIRPGGAADVPGTWNGDADGYPRVHDGDGNHCDASSNGTVAITDQTTAVTFCNKTLPKTKNVTFSKYICKTYGDVPNNEGPGGQDDIGKNDGPLATSHSDLGVDGPTNGGDAVNPGNDNRGDCALATTPWTFQLWTTDRANGSGGTLLQTVVVPAGSLSVQLNAASLAETFKGSGLYVEEVYQSGYGFGSIKCYTDHLNDDNWEWLNFQGGIPEGTVHCIAYNVPADEQILITKTFVNTGPYTPTTDDIPEFTLVPSEGTCEKAVLDGDVATIVCTVPYGWSDDGYVDEKLPEGWQSTNCSPSGLLREDAVAPEYAAHFEFCNQPVGHIILIKDDQINGAVGPLWGFHVAGGVVDTLTADTGTSIDKNEALSATPITITEDLFRSITQCEGSQSYYTLVDAPADNVLDTPGEVISWTFHNIPCGVLGTGGLIIEKYL